MNQPKRGKCENSWFKVLTIHLLWWNGEKERASLWPCGQELVQENLIVKSRFPGDGKVRNFMYLGKCVGVKVLEGCYYPMLSMDVFNKVQIFTVTQKLELRAFCMLSNMCPQHRLYNCRQDEKTFHYEAWPRGFPICQALSLFLCIWSLTNRQSFI